MQVIAVIHTRLDGGSTTLESCKVFSRSEMKEAEEHFVSYLKDEQLSADDIESALDDGYYEFTDGDVIFITWT